MAARPRNLTRRSALWRVMQSASSLIGSFPVSRVIALQAEILEQVASLGRGVDEETVDVLSSILVAIDSFADRMLSEDGHPEQRVSEAQDELADGVRAYRRYRGFPEADDGAAIAQVFYSSGTAAAANHLEVAATPPASAGHPVDGESGSDSKIVPELLEVYQLESEELIDRIYRAACPARERPSAP